MPGNSRTQERAFQIERPIGKGPAPGRTAPHTVQCCITRIPAAKSTPNQCPEKTGKRPDHHRRQENMQTVQTRNAQTTRKQENVLTSPVIKEMRPKNKQTKKTRIHFIAIRIAKLVKEWLATMPARHRERDWLAPAMGKWSPALVVESPVPGALTHQCPPARWTPC